MGDSTKGKPKDPAAVSLGRRGGSKKVAKGFSKMDPEKRKLMAKEAAARRWGKNTEEK